MQSEGAFAGQWCGGNGTKMTAGEESSSPLMSATSGPVEHFFWHRRDSADHSLNDLAPPPPSQQNLRSHSGSPTRAQLHPPGNRSLNNAKSTPVLVPSRPVGSVKNIANKFDQAGAAGNGQPPPLTIRTSQDRYRRPVGGRTPRSPQKSPTKDGIRKLQKSRPGHNPRSPMKSAATSIDTNSSMESAATITSTKSQPHAAFSPKKQSRGPYMSPTPLFGEITSDGRWNGNFDLPGCGPLPGFNQAQRRSSDGSTALGHGRSHSHQEILQPAPATATIISPPQLHHPLSHKRSRSDMDYVRQPQAPSMPNLSQQQQELRMFAMYPTPPNSASRNALPPQLPSSRIPVSYRRHSKDSAESSGPHSRSASALSNSAPGRNRLPSSPTRRNQNPNTQSSNTSAIPRSRYHPPPVSTSSNGQTLSAKIVAPLPKTSPPLRSSRPRQPVSSATTSASRARAADRYHGQVSRDGRRPSEQWLGQPYDPQKERSKRKIPELGKIDFEARRERIQKAISQNLEETRSAESLRKTSQPLEVLAEPEKQEEAPAEVEALNSADQHQAEEINRETDSMPGGWPTPGLSVDTFNIPKQKDREPEPQTANTAHTEFEEESPVLGRPSTQESQRSDSAAELPQLLTSATYQQPPAKAPTPISTVREAPLEEVQSPSVLEHVMQMRRHSGLRASTGATDDADESSPVSAEDSPSDIEDRWGLGNGLRSVEGSIKIMLDGQRGAAGRQDKRSWSQNLHDELDHINANDVTHAQYLNQQSYDANGFVHSPVSDHGSLPEDQRQATPRGKDIGRDNTIKQSDYQRSAAPSALRDNVTSDLAVAHLLEQYQFNGTVTSDMLEEMQRHVVDLQRLSANEGSNGFMIQSLLDSIMDVQTQQEGSDGEKKETLPRSSYEMPQVTPDTPPGWQYTEGSGTAVVYGNDASNEEEQISIEGEDEDDFYVKIRKADEAWEQHQHESYLRLELEDDGKPLPPPKDFGYTPRSSAGPSSATFPPDFAAGLRISTTGPRDLPDSLPADETPTSPQLEQQLDTPPISAPPQPSHAPPPPPAGPVSGLPYGLPDVPQMPGTLSERGSSEMSPRARKSIWAQSGSSRPSTDSQRPPIPGSVSMSSFTESTKKTSIDTGADSQARSSKGISPSPEQKRLLKRRHIVKELLDTENTYHQDLKIIEDIYRATAAPELIPPEDKKILFGNCDEIERFSLHFYDELRKAVVPVYQPAKQTRWLNKRGSYSTTQSDGANQTSIMAQDGVDDAKDRLTTIGNVFMANLQQMEHVYSCYLKNHDAANQRLSALRNTPPVKCWLDECHNNASDITSAWDLDSLLVKPTQRVAKYPMLLQQLLETTPQDHPDRESIATAASDSISMLTRINEAKKRADLVDQIVNRKRKDSDVRSGIAKAFGRRTEKLKERVGIAEAFQDPDFDQIAHKFGGHFIRLQICMRDVQAYMTSTEKAVEQISNFAGALEFFTDVSMSSGSEVESKWRMYGQAIREIINVAFAEHKAAVNKRVIGPMVACIELHDGPRNAINNRKKRIVDYAKCKSMDKRGEKPDKKSIEASEMYVALNDQMKIDLPKLYNLTASLVQGVLNCFLEIQLTWYNTFERKLRPVLDDIPGSIQQIEPMFHRDYDFIKNKLTEFGICNGAVLADSANFLSPSITHPDSDSSSARQPLTLDSSKRTMSVDSESSPMPGPPGFNRRSSSYAANDGLNPVSEARMRSNSNMSHRGTPSQAPVMPNRPFSSSTTPTTSSFPHSRPVTANAPSSQQQVYLPPRASAEQARSPRPTSGATYFTARPEPADDVRSSGIFNSAVPPDTPMSTRPPSPKLATVETPPSLFVCASLFEFSIDKTRKEGGYPYLTYVQGEVFDVIAQKGELWLAKNQDDSSNTLGWIWEQHFVILSQD
ncbi:hypothetical protein LTR37_004802 [Vermiconidia calcicola]|uniref:Uncharacterized protein n=1 Tax=Vermiconidia calcicola TaxID=1690605 RepID=A0ACC3NM41_9PEZI|nr:hypothetical protein LTR37_004802 [Vermiconidia calcicola]